MPERTDDNDKDPAGDFVHFGPFRLSPSRRLLEHAGQRVRLGARALDILILLVQRAGEFVPNEEIHRCIWPRTVVVDGNLRVHIAALRKLLGQGQGQNERRYIINVPHSGYCFVAPIFPSPERLEVTVELATPTDGKEATSGLPLQLTRLIGQDAALQALESQVAQRRLVTLAGPGGIGKTTLAIAVCNRLMRRPGPAPWSHAQFVDFSPVTDPTVVPAVIASALGLGASLESPQRGLVAYLHDKHCLLLLDNCEHVLPTVAPLVEYLLRSAPGLHVLATSREPLRADGEFLHRVQPLSLPPEGALPRTAEEARQYAAIELLVELCGAWDQAFLLKDADAPVATAICRQLDGIPLAIELAAARNATLGLRGISAGLGDCLQLLSRGRRTALPRHQTMRGVLAWSFALLSPVERCVLRRLSVFQAPFTMPLAIDVAGDAGTGEVGAVQVMEAVSELVSKSLLQADATQDDVWFRLLDTTRAYASEQLVQTGYAQEMRRRHAQALLARMREAEKNWRFMPTPDWVGTYGRHLEDLRAAMSFALDNTTDVGLGIALVVKVAPLMFLLAFTEEHRRFVDQALAMAPLSTPPVDGRLAAELNIVAGHVIFHTQGVHPLRDEAFDRAAAIARKVDDPQLTALVCATQWMACYQAADPQGMMRHAQRYAALTASMGDPDLERHRDRIMTPTLHLLGQQRAARLCAEQAAARTDVIRSPFLTGAHIHRAVSIGFIQARALWLLGASQEADDCITRILEISESSGEPVALANALAYSACPISLWSGRLDTARMQAKWLLRVTEEHALRAWKAFGDSFLAFLDWREAGAKGQPPALQPAAQQVPTLVQVMSTVHPAYLTEQALEQDAQGRAGWCLAEHLRIQGLWLHETDPEAGEFQLVHALELALRQDALFWAVRIAASIGEAKLAQGSARSSLALLAQRMNALDRPINVPEYAAARRTVLDARGQGT